MNEIAALTEQLDDAFPRDALDLDAVRRAVKDAERYRWMRSNNPGKYGDDEAAVDAAIDAAMSSHSG